MSLTLVLKNCSSIACNNSDVLYKLCGGGGGGGGGGGEGEVADVFVYNFKLLKL